MKHKVTIAFGVFYFLLAYVSGQETHRTTSHNFVLGVNLTGTGYYGDINYNEKGLPSSFNVLPGIEASVSKSGNKYFSPLAKLGYGRIVAQNPDLKPFYFGPVNDPNSYFEPPRFVRTDFVYLDGAIKTAPLGDANSLLRPYASVGLGGMLFFPFKNDTIPFKGFNPLRGEKFSTITATLPLGLGTEINLGEKVNLNLGTNLRIPMNDYMDLYGANLIPNRKKGSDMLFSLAVGANFNLGSGTPTTTPSNSPRIYIPPTRDALPMDTTVLASADPNVLGIILRQDPDFLAAKDFSPVEGYPEGMIPLTVLAQSLECDSIARLYDQRISSLYNENLQLRSQYKKLDFELNQALANSSSNESGSGKTDSLMRVVYNKENKIKELEKQLAEVSTPTSTQSLGESEKIAQYEKQIISLKEEVATLKAGGQPNQNESIGFTELQEKYTKLEGEKQSLEEEYNAMQTQNAMIRKELETLRLSPNTPKPAAGEEELQARIDSLIRENQRLLFDFETLKKEYLVLRQDFDDLKAGASDVDALRTQLASIQNQKAEYETRIDELKKENETLKGENLAEIKAKLDQTLVFTDTLTNRYNRLQAVIENYESLLADSKHQNDELALEIKQLKDAANSAGNGQADSVRFVSLVAEIDELNMELTVERQQKKKIEEDLTLANTRNKELEGENNSLKEGELDIAMSRIAVLEKENQELKAINAMSDNQNDTLSVDSVLASSLYAQIEALKKDKEELLIKNQEISRRMEIQGASGSGDSTQWISRISTVNHEKDSLQRVIDAFQTEVPEGNEQLLALQRENLMLKNENARVVEILEENKTAFAPLNEKIQSLEAENATLGNEKQEFIAQVSELQTQKAGLEDKLNQQTEESVTAQALTDTRNELDLVKREKDNLLSEKTELSSQNATLKTTIDSLSTVASSLPLPSGTDSVAVNKQMVMISALGREKDSLQRVIDAFQTEVPEGNEQLLALQRENLMLKNENARMLEVLEGNKEGFTPLKEEIARLTDENVALSAEKVRLEQEVALKTGAISCEELGMQVQQLEAENNLMRQQLAKSVVMQNEMIETQDLLVQKDIAIANLQQKLSDITVNSDVQEVVALKDEEITTLTNERNALSNKLAETDKRLLVAENELKVALERGGNPQLQAQVEALIAERDAFKKQYEEAIAENQGSEPVVAPGIEEFTAQIETLRKENQRLSDENQQLKAGSEPVVAPGTEEFTAQIETLRKENQRLSDENQQLKAGSEPVVAPGTEEFTAQIETLRKENQRLSDENQQLKAGSEPVVAPGTEEFTAQIETLHKENQRLSDENQQLKAGMKSEGNEGTVVVELNQQVSELSKENDKLREQLKLQTSLTSGDVSEKDQKILELNGMLTEKEDEVLAIRSQNNILLEERDRWKTLYEGNAANTGTQPLPTPDEKDEQLVVLKNQVQALTEENNMLKSQNTMPENEQLLALQQEVRTLTNQNEQLSKQMEDVRPALENLMTENAELRKQAQEMKTPNTEQEEQNKQIVELKKKLADSQEEIKNLMSNKGEDLLVMYKEENDVFKQRIGELQEENAKLTDQLANSGNGEIAVLMQEKLVLATENETLNAELQQLRNRPSSSGQEELVASLRGRIEAQENEIVRLNDKLKATGIPEAPESGDYTKAEETEALRKQNQELFDENESLRNALSNALNSLYNAQSAANGAAPGNAEYESLKTNYDELMAQKTVLENQVATLSERLKNSNTGGDHDLLVAQNSTLIDQNNQLMQRIKVLEETAAPMPGSSEELDFLRKQNTDLNDNVIALQSKVSALNREVETYKNISVSGQDSGEMEKLMTENATLREQIEKNTEYVSSAIDQHNKDLSRIAELEEKLAATPVTGINTEDYEGKITALKSENQNLKNQLAILEQKGKNEPAPSTVNPPSLNEAALARRAAEVDARERRIVQREEYIELKEEQLTLADAKIKASAAREIELRMLEQDLKGFWDYQSDVMVDGTPCFPVSAFIPKAEVMSRINDYFSAQGYKYKIIEGKMVYTNVTIPEIDPTKPLNISLYMMVSSENNNKRVLQGAFQYAEDRTYITSEKYPTQSIRAVKILQKVSQ